MPEAKKKPKTAKVCQDTLTTLETACKSLTVENARLRENVDSWQQQARQAERDHRNVDRHLQEEKAGHARLLESRRLVRQGLDEVERWVADGASNRAMSRAFLEAEKGALHDDHTQHIQKTNELENVAQQLEQRSQVAAELTAQGVQERQQLQDDLATLKAEHNALRASFAASVEMRKELAHRLQSLEYQALDAERSLMSRKRQIATESQDLNRTVEMLRADFVAVESQREKEISALQAQVKETEETDQERAELVKSALEELTQCQDVLKQWEERVDALNAQCSSAKEQCRSSEFARVAAEKSQEGKEREFSRTQAEVKRLESLKVTLEDQARYLEVSHLGLKEAYSWLVLEEAGGAAKKLLEDYPASEVSAPGKIQHGRSKRSLASQPSDLSPLKQQLKGLGPAGRKTPSPKSAASLERSSGRDGRSRIFTFQDV